MSPRGLNPLLALSAKGYVPHVGQKPSWDLTSEENNKIYMVRDYFSTPGFLVHFLIHDKRYFFAQIIDLCSYKHQKSELVNETKFIYSILTFIFCYNFN